MKACKLPDGRGTVRLEAKHMWQEWCYIWGRGCIENINSSSSHPEKSKDDDDRENSECIHAE